MLLRRLELLHQAFMHVQRMLGIRWELKMTDHSFVLYVSARQPSTCCMFGHVKESERLTAAQGRLQLECMKIEA